MQLRPADETEVQRAARCVLVVFGGAGLLFATWVSRIPQVRTRLHLDPGSLGLLLLSLAVGAFVALPLAGGLTQRLGPRRTVGIFAVLGAAGLAMVGFGSAHGPLPVGIGLFATGLGYGTWDVAMNVEAAQVEQRLGRAVMPRFHAGFSVGTVAGAVVGAALVAAHVSVTVHLVVVAGLLAAAIPVAARGFLPEVAPHPDDPGRPRVLMAWTERRTLLIGVFVLTVAFSEGTGNDWLGVAVVDGYHAPAVLGSLGYAVFVTSMTTGRWFGPPLIDRWGRVRILRGGAALSLIGLLVVVFGHVLGVALLGAVLWGLGTSLGFPVGMSAASDDPRWAAARVSVVSSVGYTAFVAGPPLIGLLGDHVGTLHALTLTTAALAVALLAAGSCAPLRADVADRAHR
jgi:MFS family permease